MFLKKDNWKNYFTIRKINQVIRILTLSDVLIISSFGLIAPIFAIFVTDSISGGNIAVVGIAEAIYLISKSLLQIPAASIIDRIKGEKDDFWAMFVGSIAFSLVPLLYLAISSPFELYLVQFIYGLATAVTLPSWYAIFTRHIDKKHEGVEWGVYQTFVDLGSGAAALIGGLLAYYFGFNNLFILVSIISFIGSFSLLGIYQRMKKGYIFFRN